MIDVFISHSHDDQETAKRLVEFLINGLGIKIENIRCTSVSGTKLQMGSKIADQLRKDIEDSFVFLPLLTPKTKIGGFVTLEIGAAWGLKKVCIPVLHKFRGKLPEVLAGNLYCNLKSQDDIVDLGTAIYRAVFSGRPDKAEKLRITAAAKGFWS